MNASNAPHDERCEGQQSRIHVELLNPLVEAFLFKAIRSSLKCIVAKRWRSKISYIHNRLC